MLKASWIALLPVSMLLAADCLADDAEIDDQLIPLITHAATASNAERDFSYLWQQRYPVAVSGNPDDWPDWIAEIEFHDSSMYGRVSHLRNLSLLTLAEFGQKRLFLGVNADGLVGIHFNVFSDDDPRYLEVVRMPYLKDSDSDSEVDQPEPGSETAVAQQMTSYW